MGKFDTHGGYFAPQGYFRINAGGSHEENPNGGVQIGVDEQGVPNMLEEGEPVYNDYVYSDNIYADGGTLERFNLPKTYAGKLYSEIADLIVDEASERPNDPISNNGLNALLLRLANAQEAQKQLEQQKDVERELENMSPEQLAQLEEMLSQQEAAQEGEGMVAPEEQESPEMMQPGEAGAELAGMPIQPFACGGFIRTFGDGTPGRVIPFNVNPETGAVTGGQYMPGYVESDGTIHAFDTIEPSVAVAFPGKTQAWVDAQVGPQSIRKQVSQSGTDFLRAAAESYADNYGTIPFDLATGGIGTGLGMLNAATDAAHGDYIGAIIAAGSQALKIKKGARLLEDARKVISKGRQGAQALAKTTAAFESATKKAAEAASREQALVRRAGRLQKEFDSVVESLANNPDMGAMQEAAAKASMEAHAERLEKVTKKAVEAQKASKAAQKELKDVKKAFKKAGGKVPADNPVPSPSGPDAGKASRSLPGWAGGAGAAGLLLGSAAYSISQNAGSASDYVPPVGPSPYQLQQQQMLMQQRAAQKDSSNVATTQSAPRDSVGMKIFDWMNELATGGPMNRFDDGGLAAFLKVIGDYTGSLGKSAANGRYAIDTNKKYWNGRTGRQVQAEDGYKKWTDYVYNYGDKDPRLLPYFQKLDSLINKETGAPTLLDANGKLVGNWRDIWMGRRNDGILGVYHLTPTDFDYTLPAEPAPAPATVAPAQVTASPRVSNPYGPFVPSGNYPLMSQSFARTVQPGPDGTFFNYNQTVDVKQPWESYSFYPQGFTQGYSLYPKGTEPRLTDYAALARSGKIAPPRGEEEPTIEETEPYYGGITPLPTFPMYMGPIASGLLALNTALQEPDHYTLDPVRPATPYGRMSLQHQVYQPVDQNMMANAVQSQGMATTRALQNSGLGPSAAAAIIAADNNTTQNRGMGFLQTWQANNDARNKVIAANNAADAQMAQFDFGVDKARADALNYARMMQPRYDLMLQQLNYDAESAKYAALSKNLDNAMAGLSAVGRQNATMNQINSNRALYDMIWPNLIAQYKDDPRKKV